MLGPVIAVAGIGALALLASSSSKSSSTGGPAPVDGTGGKGPPVPSDGSKVPPGIKLITCEQAYAMLPPALQILVTNAQKAGPAEMNNAADAMDSAASAPGLTPDAANTLHVAAGCLRSLATGALGKSGAPTGTPAPAKPIGEVDSAGIPYNPTGGADRPDCASNPAAQYKWTVAAGQSASLITARILGSANATPANWSKLVSLNATTDMTGQPTGTVGSPGTLGYNFKRLMTGYQLRIPREWNQYIGQAGVLKASMTPLPACG